MFDKLKKDDLLHWNNDAKRIGMDKENAYLS